MSSALNDLNLRALTVVGLIAAALLSVWLFVALRVAPGWWVDTDWLLNLLALLPAFGICQAVSAVRRRRLHPRPMPGELWVGFVLLAGLFIYFFSSAQNHPETFFNHPLRGLMELRLQVLCIGSAVLTPLFFFRRVAWWRSAVWFILAAAIGICGYELLHATGGLAIYRDDHPPFMQRMWIFGQTFPQVLYYDPFWNAGGAQSYLVSSGSLAPGVLLWPLWRFTETHEIFTYALGGFYLLMIPGLFILSIRLIGGSWTAAAVSALLGISTTRFFYLWALHYGTFGFSVSMPFLLPMIACLYRVLWMNRREWWTGAILIGSGYCFLSWPVSSVLLIPVLLALVVSFRRFNRYNLLFFFICALILGTLLIPNALAILNHSRLKQLGAMSREAPGLAEILRSGIASAPLELRRANPFLLFLGVVGFIFLRQPGLKLFVGTLMVGFLLLAFFGGEYKPQFDLHRAVIPLFYLAAIPAAIWVVRFFNDESPMSALPAAACLMLLVVGAWTVSSFWGNVRDIDTAPEQHTRQMPPEYYTTLYPYIEEFADWVKTNVPEDGRVMFAGRNDMSYGRGHIAYLPILCQREMMASDYYHFPAALVTPTYPPPEWQSSAAAMKIFCEHFNITHVVTYQDMSHHLKRLREHPNDFQPAFEFGTARKFYVFEVQHESNPFYQGSGKVSAGINRIDVTLDDVIPPADGTNSAAIIRYNWAEGLRATGAKLKKETVGISEFIGIIPDGSTPDITIRYRKLL